MAARKYKKRRNRKGGGGVILSFLTFCVVVAAIVMSVTVFLKVATIEVRGLTKYDPNEVIRTSQIENGDNMFMINKFEVANRILDAYPYIEQIKIRRRLPDTFTFEITERVPAGYVETEGSRWLVDKKGYLLEMLSDEDSVTVPKISGVEVLTPQAGGELVLKNDAQLEPLREVMGALFASGMIDRVVRIDVEKLYDIRVVYGDRFLVNLGDTSELSRKIEMLRVVIEQLAEFDKGTINVSAVKEARFRPDANIDLSEAAKVPEVPTPAEGEETEAPAEGEENPLENSKDDSEIPPQ